MYREGGLEYWKHSGFEMGNPVLPCRVINSSLASPTRITTAAAAAAAAGCNPPQLPLLLARREGTLVNYRDITRLKLHTEKLAFHQTRLVRNRSTKWSLEFRHYRTVVLISCSYVYFSLALDIRQDPYSQYQGLVYIWYWYSWIQWGQFCQPNISHHFPMDGCCLMGTLVSRCFCRLCTSTQCPHPWFSLLTLQRSIHPITSWQASTLSLIPSPPSLPSPTHPLILCRNVH